MKRATKGDERELDVDLPDDLLVKILLLLPFGSILACKRVSKRWKDVINHPNFGKRYRHKGSMLVMLVDNNLYCLLVTTRHNNTSNDPSYTVHRVPVRLQKVDRIELEQNELVSGWSDRVVVVCVKGVNGYFHLYNLLTGASDTVTSAPLRLHSRMWLYYGFGYCSRAAHDGDDDEYKIVVVCYYKAEEWLQHQSINSEEAKQNEQKSRMWVYSSRSGRWESLDAFPHASYHWPHFFLPGPCYSLNGVLYSVANRLDPVSVKGKRAILTLDLDTLRFGEISVPEEGAVCEMAEVTGFEGQLCYAYRSTHTWVVECYNAAGGRGWTRLLTIDRFAAASRLFECLEYMAFYTLIDDECRRGDDDRRSRKVGLFVCNRHSKLFRYDFNKNETHEIHVHHDATTTTSLMRK